MTMQIKFEEVMQRLKNKLGLESDASIARILNMTPPAYTERKRRESLPYEQIIDICRKRGISIDYLITGKTEEFSGQIIYECERSDVDEDEMIVVPYFKDIRAAAGAGCLNDDSSEGDISYIVLPRDGYPELSRASEHLHAITAHGDSMEGNIYDGAILLVDFGDKGSESGKIYVVNAGGEVMVKRLFNDPSNADKILLQSDNIYYPKFTLDRSEVDVVGRVVFVYNRAKLV
jgi:phage repressor protein C with HTH and peptisase S24 domain